MHTTPQLQISEATQSGDDATISKVTGGYTVCMGMCTAGCTCSLILSLKKRFSMWGILFLKEKREIVLCLPNSHDSTTARVRECMCMLLARLQSSGR